MLLNLDPPPPPNPDTTPISVSTVKATLKRLPRTYLYCPPETWEWTHLRDYVVYEITKLTGEFSGHPSSGAAEAQIFKSFIARHGENAQRIARYALDTCGGLWYSEPVTIFDFCKNSDPQFAEPILRNLEAS